MCLKSRESNNKYFICSTFVTKNDIGGQHGSYASDLYSEGPRSEVLRAGWM
jgi:hypothetical protein